MATIVESDLEGSHFYELLDQRVREGTTPFPGLLHFTVDLYLTMLSVKQGGIKYHFFESFETFGGIVWDWFIAKIILISRKYISFEVIQNGSKSNRLEQRSGIKSLVAEKRKSCEI